MLSRRPFHMAIDRTSVDPLCQHRSITTINRSHMSSPVTLHTIVSSVSSISSVSQYRRFTYISNVTPTLIGSQHHHNAQTDLL